MSPTGYKDRYDGVDRPIDMLRSWHDGISAYTL